MSKDFVEDLTEGVPQHVAAVHAQILLDHFGSQGVATEKRGRARTLIDVVLRHLDRKLYITIYGRVQQANLNKMFSLSGASWARSSQGRPTKMLVCQEEGASQLFQIFNPLG